METETGEQTAVLMDPYSKRNGDEGSLYPGSHVYDDDVRDLLSRKINRGTCHHVKRCVSWLNFGLLCLLVGGLAGYYLIPYFVTRNQQGEIDPRRVTETAESTAEELHTLPEEPLALKQMDNTNVAKQQDHHVTGNHAGNHVTKDEMVPDENMLINNAVKQILENMTGIQGLSAKQLNTGFNLTKDPSQKVYLSVGMRNDYLLQACGEGQLKQSFPDVDYAFFGYNILQGFPLSVGHDPGFTLPIFKADYSTGGQSADCRYSIPKGLVIVPDVSCVTSFSSEIIKTQKAFSDSMGANAGVHASGWGVSFEMSGSYKKAKSELENQEKVYILSSAKCNYYFSKLVAANAPELNHDFLQWVRRLETTADQDTYIKFFNTYGTHFPVETTFGARYTYEYSMTSSMFEKKENEGMDIKMAASYSGLFSVGGSFGINKEQEKMASDFAQNTETKTVTVGAAPPSDGDAMKWASNVQLNPVPVYYRLSSIENLFTADYMHGLNIDYASIYRNLVRHKDKYRGYLNRNALVEKCKAVQESYFVLDDTRLLHQRYYRTGPLSDCLDECFKDESCKAISFNEQADKCLFYTGGQISGTNIKSWKTFLLRKNNTETIEMVDTEITGTSYSEETTVSLSECEDLCRKHDLCFALSFSNTCKLFKKGTITNAFRNDDSNAVTKFVSKCANVDVVQGELLKA